MQRIICLLIVSCFCSSAFSFPYKLDSLYEVLESPRDTARWSASIYLSEQFHFIERKPDSVYKYLYLYRDEMQKAEDWKRLAYLSGIEAKYWSKRAQTEGLPRAQDTVINTYRRMARYAILAGDSISLGEAYNGIGGQFERQSLEDSSSWYGLEAIRIYEALGHPRLTTAYLYYGNSFHRLGDEETALQYWQAAWRQLQKGKKVLWQEMAIAMYLSDAFIGSFEQGANPSHLDSCGKFLNISRRAAFALKDQEAIAWHTSRFPRYHLLRGEYALGLAVSDTALNYSRQDYGRNGPLAEDLCRSYYTRAILLLRSGNASQALACADSAVVMAQAIQTPFSFQKAYFSRYEVRKVLNDAKGALSDLEQSNVYRDSLNIQQKQGRILALENQYRANKKEQENLRLGEELAFQVVKVRQRNLLIGLGALAIVLAVIIVVVLFRHRVAKDRQSRLELEQKLLRSQINPHFFFNVLTSIQNMVLQQRHTPEIVNQISRLAKLMRQTLESSFIDYIPLEEELKSIHNYLELQKNRFQQDFDFEIEVDSEETSRLHIPPMITQPLLENALEHGIQRVRHKGLIKVRFTMEKGELYLTVQDNGIGISRSAAFKASPEAEAHVSRASQITRERLQLLSRKKHFFFLLKDRIVNGKVSGTEARLALPFSSR